MREEPPALPDEEAFLSELTVVGKVQLTDDARYMLRIVFGQFQRLKINGSLRDPIPTYNGTMAVLTTAKRDIKQGRFKEFWNDTNGQERLSARRELHHALCRLYGSPFLVDEATAEQLLAAVKEAQTDLKERFGRKGAPYGAPPELKDSLAAIYLSCGGKIGGGGDATTPFGRFVAAFARRAGISRIKSLGSKGTQRWKQEKQK
jgi:hypothetical protein